VRRKMSEKEQELRKNVRQFAETKLRPIAIEADEMDDISWEVVKMLAEGGLFKYAVPDEYGGVGVKCVALCIIREELARVCIQSDDTFAMSGLGSYPIIRFGTEEQKRRYLPPIASGDKIASFALTEPGHGSDVANIET
jgi:alkylation response protein AidB-like acyl-CoA dehydrogenase